MRPALLPAALLALLALAPVVPAGTGTGEAYGVAVGRCDAGGWDLWWFDTVGGPISVSLTWSDGPMFIDADYDLLVYNWSDYDDDGALTEEPYFAKETRSFTQRSESLQATVAAGRYVLAVVPHQAQGDGYTLTATPGKFTGTYPPAPGVRGYTPLTYCVF